MVLESEKTALKEDVQETGEKIEVVLEHRRNRGKEIKRKIVKSATMKEASDKLDDGSEDSKDFVDKMADKIEEKKEAEEQNFAILPPVAAEGPGENGKPYKVDTEKMDKKIKKRIERGWQNNAFNEYVSDLISVHR